MITWLLLAACTDWGSALPPTNTPPIAVAETLGGTTISLGETASFSGAASSDPDGVIAAWQWSVAEAPDGSAAGLRDAWSAEITFIPDLPGSYTLSLRVWDDRGGVSAPDVAALIVEDTGGADTGGADTGGVVEDDPAEDTGSPGVVDTDGPGDEADPEDTSDVDLAGKGCGCSSTGSGPASPLGGLAAVALGALALVRRRE